MTPERYEELLGRLLDGELNPAEGEELAASLRADHEQRRDCRQHLGLWDLCSQQLDPGRSAQSFMDSWRTRCRAEREAPPFRASLCVRFARKSGDRRPKPASGLLRWWARVPRPAGIAWASVGAMAAVVAVVWLALPNRAHGTVTLRGEGVCTACILHQTRECSLALRVSEPGGTQLYYATPDPRFFRAYGAFCQAPVPVVAIGQTRTEQGRQVIVLGALSPASLPPSPSQTPHQ